MGVPTQLQHLFTRENAGGMRVFLFSKFYEDILRTYLVQRRYQKVFTGARITRAHVPVPRKPISENHSRLIDALINAPSNRKYWVPDGLFLDHNNRYIVWEAKNWVQELFYSPFSENIWNFAWLLAKQIQYGKLSYPISGFLISWWDRESDLEEALVELRKCINPLPIDVIYTKDVLEECINAQYAWYLDIVREKQKNIAEFFDILLGATK